MLVGLGSLGRRGRIWEEVWLCSGPRNIGSGITGSPTDACVGGRKIKRGHAGVHTEAQRVGSSDGVEFF